MQLNHSIWAIVPAAGIGRRMQSSVPKQYLELNGRPVLEYTVSTLLQNANISGLVIALQPDDSYWPTIETYTTKPIIEAEGGNERSDSVLNAIDTLCELDQFNESDWVMVHDAVRPCLRQQDIDRLIYDVGENKNGGLLALPVRDTMKRQKSTEDASAETACVAKTINRDNLWHALTPQYFPALLLKDALEKARQKSLDVTDESSAMELAGYSPKLIPGNEDNIKITRPDDLRLAALYQQAQQV